MNSIVVIANLDILRAFRLGSSNSDGSLTANEIILPPDAAARRPWQDTDWRMDEIAENVNWLLREEDAHTWVFAAPFGLIVNVLPALDLEAKDLLSGAEIEDLTGLTPGEVGRYFETLPTLQAA